MNKDSNNKEACRKNDQSKEDEEDLAAIEERKDEPDLKLEDVIKDMKRRGRI